MVPHPLINIEKHLGHIEFSQSGQIKIHHTQPTLHTSKR